MQVGNPEFSDATRSPLGRTESLVSGIKIGVLATLDTLVVACRFKIGKRPFGKLT